MQPDMIKLLRSYLRTHTDGSPYLFRSNRRVPIDRSLYYLLDPYADQAGLPEKKHPFHCLEHSIAMHLLDAGGDLSFVKEWLGRTNV